MTDNLETLDTIEDDVIVLIIGDHVNLLNQSEALNYSIELKRRYQSKKEELAGKKPHCIVEVQSSIASSPIARVIYELWKEVVENNHSQLICIRYPSDYIHSLDSLGITSLPNFLLDTSLNRIKAAKKVKEETLNSQKRSFFKRLFSFLNK